MHRLKRCEYNNEDEYNTLNDNKTKKEYEYSLNPFFTGRMWYKVSFKT